MRDIRSPALVFVGDADVIRPEQAVEEYRLIPHSRLAVLPGTDHMSLTSRTAWLTPMIKEFLMLRCHDPGDGTQRESAPAI